MNAEEVHISMIRDAVRVQGEHQGIDDAWEPRDLI